MNIFSKTKNARFAIDSDPQSEGTVSTERLMENATGTKSTVPMVVYLFAHLFFVNSDEHERVFALSQDLYGTEEALVIEDEAFGKRLQIDLDKYQPK